LWDGRVVLVGINLREDFFKRKGIYLFFRGNLAGLLEEGAVGLGGVGLE